MPDFGIIFWITAILLIVGYIVMEIARGISVRTGTVIRLIESDVPMASLLECEMEVDLDDGRRVKAVATGCALCQSGFGPGVRVSLLKHKQGWLVSSTNRKHFRCEKA